MEKKMDQQMNEKMEKEMEKRKERAVKLLQELKDEGYTLEDLIQAIELTGKKTKDETRISIKIRTSSLLKELGVPMHINGYVYLRRAVELAYDDREMLQNVTKKLYPEVAKEFKTTASRVERAMRHAIEKMCDNVVDRSFYDEVFGNTVSGFKGKPTNSECIAAMVEYMKLEDEARR